MRSLSNPYDATIGANWSSDNSYLQIFRTEHCREVRSDIPKSQYSFGTQRIQMVFGAQHMMYLPAYHLGSRSGHQSGRYREKMCATRSENPRTFFKGPLQVRHVFKNVRRYDQIERIVIERQRRYVFTHRAVGPHAASSIVRVIEGSRV